MIFKGKRKDVPVTYNIIVNDGKWHKIQLNKKKRKLIMILDSKLKKSVRIPKTVVKNEMYLGGVPHGAEIMKSRMLVCYYFY